VRGRLRKPVVVTWARAAGADTNERQEMAAKRRRRRRRLRSGNMGTVTEAWEIVWRKGYAGGDSSALEKLVKIPLA